MQLSQKLAKRFPFMRWSATKGAAYGKRATWGRKLKAGLVRVRRGCALISILVHVGVSLALVGRTRQVVPRAQRHLAALLFTLQALKQHVLTSRAMQQLVARGTVCEACMCGGCVHLPPSAQK